MGLVILPLFILFSSECRLQHHYGAVSHTMKNQKPQLHKSYRPLSYLEQMILSISKNVIFNLEPHRHLSELTLPTVTLFAKVSLVHELCNDLALNGPSPQTL